MGIGCPLRKIVVPHSGAAAVRVFDPKGNEVPSQINKRDLTEVTA